MIELVFVACLSATPQMCEEKSMQFAENLTPSACMMGAQPELAKWIEGHPKWRIARWKCRPIETRQVKA